MHLGPACLPRASRPGHGARITVLALVVALGLVAGVAMPSARATSVQPMSLDDLTDTSDFVVEATVLGSETELTPHIAGMPVWTWTRIRVDRYIKGTGTLELMVKQPGGVIGNRVVSVEGLAPLANGSRFILFLHGADGRAGAVTPVGYGAGAYRITPGLGGRLWASRDTTVAVAQLPRATTSVPGGVVNGVTLAPRAVPRDWLLTRITQRAAVRK